MSLTALIARASLAATLDCKKVGTTKAEITLTTATLISSSINENPFALFTTLPQLAKAKSTALGASLTVNGVPDSEQ